MLVSSTYTPDGCLPCDGTEYNKSDYSSFYINYLAGGKLVTCTYEEYQQDITTYGQCAKFALDTTNNKFKVPTIKDGSYLTQALSDVEIGKAYNESLPNITGAISCGVVSQPHEEGALYKEEDKPGFDGSYSGPDSTMSRLMLNASRSSSTYQDGAKVQGDNVRVRFFVVVSNAEELDVPEINKIEFNNPFFFGDYKWSEINIENSSWLRSDATFHSGSTYADFYNWILLNKNNQIDSGISVKTSTETYDDYDYVVNETDGTFRLPLNVKGASGSAVVGNGSAIKLSTITGENFNIKDTELQVAGNQTANNLKNVLQIKNGGSDLGIGISTMGLSTDGTKSGIEISSIGLSLYFYVGETLQKTNVIDISKLQKQIDNLIFNNKDIIRDYLMADYGAGISVSSGFVAPSRGWYRHFGVNVTGKTYINGVQVDEFVWRDGKWAGHAGCTLLLDKGDIITGNTPNAMFYPFKDDKIKSLNKTQLQVVDALPETPDEDTFYFIKGE